jgi:hypothetical protein
MCVSGSCLAVATDCASDAACGAGAICCGGQCRQADCCVDAQNPDARCTTGETCVQGVCQAHSCSDLGDACSRDADCCGALYCLDGACEVERGPDDHLPGKPGPIMVTTLPRTGVDDDDSGGQMAVLLGGSIASGAAGLWVAIRRYIRASSIP